MSVPGPVHDTSTSTGKSNCRSKDESSAEGLPPPEQVPSLLAEATDVDEHAKRNGACMYPREWVEGDWKEPDVDAPLLDGASPVNSLETAGAVTSIRGPGVTVVGRYPTWYEPAVIFGPKVYQGNIIGIVNNSDEYLLCYFSPDPAAMKLKRFGIDVSGGPATAGVGFNLEWEFVPLERSARVTLFSAPPKCEDITTPFHTGTNQYLTVISADTGKIVAFNAQVRTSRKYKISGKDVEQCRVRLGKDALKTALGVCPPSKDKVATGIPA
jgi:hypothetical protein